jgi:hypothetical protein
MCGPQSPETPAPKPPQNPPKARDPPDLLQALQVVTQLGLQGAGRDLAKATVLDVLLPAG